MLTHTKSLYERSIAAKDGHIGHITDLYFDDQRWRVRYVVVDTGSWLAGRQVLLAPRAFDPLQANAAVLHSGLTKAQIEASPSIETHRPVSRQFEVEYYRHYGWPGYWDGGSVWGEGAYPALGGPKAEVEQRFQAAEKGDQHLRSTRSITGYAIEANNGSIGKLSGLMVDDRSWTIPELVVDTGEWFSSGEVRVATESVVKVSFEASTVFVGLSQEAVRSRAESELARTTGADGFQD